MQYPFTVPGFENRQLCVETGGFWSGAKLLIDGEPAPKGPKRGQFSLRRLDGTEVIAQLRITNYLDPIPQVIIEGHSFSAVEPLKWYQWVWGGLPFALVIIGGALGGLFGGIALVINGRMFRSNRNGWAKYLLSGAISLGAVIAYFVSAFLFNQTVLNFVPKVAREFRSETGNFSVQTPYTLKETTQSIETQVGPIDIHIFSGEQGNEVVLVGYSDYPMEIIQASSAEQILDGSRDGAVENVKGELISETQITLDGYPGREVIIQASAENKQEIIMHGRIFLVEQRLYQIMAVVPKGKETAQHLDSFLQSFKLLGK